MKPLQCRQAPSGTLCHRRHAATGRFAKEAVEPPKKDDENGEDDENNENDENDENDEDDEKGEGWLLSKTTL